MVFLVSITPIILSVSVYPFFDLDFEIDFTSNENLKKEMGHNFSFISNRSKTAGTERKESPVQPRELIKTLHEPSDHHSKDKTSGC